MCLYPRSDIRNYWSRKNKDPFIKSTKMTREDWEDINIMFFHLDNEIIELLEKGLNEAFREYWTPVQKVVIDESMRKFKGELIWLQVVANIIREVEGKSLHQE